MSIIPKGFIPWPIDEKHFSFEVIEDFATEISNDKGVVHSANGRNMALYVDDTLVHFTYHFNSPTVLILSFGSNSLESICNEFKKYVENIDDGGLHQYSCIVAHRQRLTNGMECAFIHLIATE